MANPLTKVIMGNMVNQKKKEAGERPQSYGVQNLSATEAQSLLSLINQRKKVEAKQHVIGQPHQRTMVTLAELSGKEPEEEMMDSNRLQQQGKEMNHRIQKISLEDMSKGYGTASKKRR